jgi:hypothetical protein
MVDSIHSKHKAPQEPCHGGWSKKRTLDVGILQMEGDGIVIPVGAAAFAAVVALPQSGGGHGRGGGAEVVVAPALEVEEVQPHEAAPLQLDGLLQLGRLLLLFQFPPQECFVASNVPVHHPRS